MSTLLEQKNSWANKCWAQFATFALVFSLLLTAAAAQEISVGQIGPFTVLPSPDAHDVNKGAQAYFNDTNANGGIRGRRISFFKLDDKFNGDEFARQLELAAQQKPIALLTPIGSAGMNNAIKNNLFDKYDFIVMNAVPGADIFRNPGHPRLFHIRASDGQQIEKILRNASAVGVKKVQVLHQDLPIGIAGLAAARKAGQANGQNVNGTQSKDEPAQLSAAALEVFKASPEGVLVIGAPKFMADSVAQLRKAGFTGSVFALSYVPPSLLVKLAGEGARGVGIAKTYPNPMSPVLPLAREFQASMAKHYADLKTYSDFHFEGYISAKMLVEGMKRTGSKLTADGLARSLKTMGRTDLGGFSVDFSKGNAGSNFVDIAVISSEGTLRY